MPDPRIGDGVPAGFARRALPGDAVTIDVAIGGSGPPLLLLHGWPQTRMCWSAIGLMLAERFTVVMPDLRGYGRSEKPAGSGDGALYSKRLMGRDVQAVMQSLGHSRFAVAGHDRGGRVAYRLALDHPETVTRLAVLDIVPTADVWAGIGPDAVMGMWHWSFLAQPGGLAERLIAPQAEWFVRYILARQSVGFGFPEANLADYVSCATPAAVHGWCEDYRAGRTIDRQLDERDRGRLLPMPLLALWGARGALGSKDVLATWRAWAQHVEGEALPCGHFLPEEASEAVAAKLAAFFF